MKNAAIENPRSRQGELGQFLTASLVADFMASMFGPSRSDGCATPRDRCGPDICKKMAARLIGRELYKPVFRSRVLRPGEVSIDQYNHTRARLKENGLFSPESRRELERKLAAKCGMETGEVALYCAPSAPGYSKAIFRIAKSPTKSGNHEVLELELLKRHASLWSLFVFAPPDAPLSKAQKLVEAVQEHFSLQNELNIPAIQRNLQLWTL